MDELHTDSPVPPPPLTVGIVYNLKGQTAVKTEDEDAEYDSIETVHAIAGVLEANGYATVLLEADDALPDKLRQTRPDIAFNIAEGRCGRGREAQVPAVLQLYGIPFTGSDETTLCLALDKALTKRLLRSYHVRTPDYTVFHPGQRCQGHIAFPSIVKPVAEGSSKGIREKCVVNSREELDALLRINDVSYHEDMLVEQYIEGREFTVGVLGNGADLRVFEPMEIAFRHPTQGQFHVYSFDVKKHYKEHIEYHCPAALTQAQRRELMNTTAKVFAALGCQDFTRMDYRMAPDGTLYFIEANPLPGLAPGYSDYPMLAQGSGVDYDALVLGVLRAALKRLGMTPGISEKTI